MKVKIMSMAKLIKHMNDKELYAFVTVTIKEIQYRSGADKIDILNNINNLLALMESEENGKD